MFPPALHRKFYLLGLVITAVALPVSVFATSVGLLFLLGNFLLQGQFVRWGRLIAQNKTLQLALLLYLSILVSAFYSSNLHTTFVELRLWLPILFSPLVVALSNRLQKSEFMAMLAFFTASVVVASIIATYRLRGFWSGQILDIRQISKYISHIRFSLMVNLAIASLLYIYKNFDSHNRIVKPAIVVLMLWLVAFLVILQSFTGLVIFFVLIVVVAGFVAFKSCRSLRFVPLVLAVVLLLAGVGMSIFMFNKFYCVQDEDVSTLPAFTPNGNRYTHDLGLSLRENGYLVHINLCESELRRAWNARSALAYDSLDRRGQPLRQTLCRYLTSMGQTKDSLGLCALNREDIYLIENGTTSVLLRGWKGLFYSRFYQLFSEFELYRATGFVGGSLVRRWVYAQTALRAIAQHPWFGVGCGDAFDSLCEFYAQMKLEQKYWYSSHNQYLTTMVRSGIFGLLLFMAGILGPFVLKKLYRHWLPMFFMLMMLCSMLTEDTLNTHTGISFYAYFAALFTFGYNFADSDDKLL